MPRDSFDRSGFVDVSFRKGVVAKGSPREERGWAPTFKPTKPSKSTGAKLKKRKVNEPNESSLEQPAKRSKVNSDSASENKVRILKQDQGSKSSIDS